MKRIIDCRTGVERRNVLVDGTPRDAQGAMNILAKNQTPYPARINPENRLIARIVIRLIHRRATAVNVVIKHTQLMAPLPTPARRTIGAPGAGPDAVNSVGKDGLKGLPDMVSGPGVAI